MNKQIANYAVTAAIALAVALLVTAAERKWLPQRSVVGTVEMRSMVDDFVKQLADSKASREEIEQQVTGYATALNAAARDLGSRYQILIVPSEAVLSGGYDLTPELKAIMADRMAASVELSKAAK